jgi:FkbM family methyltransferase
MTFISYAQNFEDVVLWRALKDVRDGFYIDIGAQDPERDSISLAFYEHGWRGVHVEPTSQFATKLRNARPGEIVEQVAVGPRSSHIRFFEFPDSGLSTADFQIAEAHRQRGYVCKETLSPTISMDELLDRYSDREIHWLKIDVEGFEQQVLNSWISSEARPWIIVVESTLPLTQTEVHHNWESLVLAKGYKFAYFDGLNRFYVSEKHSFLSPKIGLSPNIFDQFVITESHSLASLLTSRAEEARRHLHLQIDLTELRISSLTLQLEEIESSMFWRLTKPFRVTGKIIRNLTRILIESKHKDSPTQYIRRSLIDQVERHIRKNPYLKSSAKQLLQFSPRLNRLIRHQSNSKTIARRSVNDLSNTERQILEDMKSAITRQRFNK